jgi:hypothetical protein
MKKNIIGWTSVVLIILAYGLITAEVITVQQNSYHILNFIGGSGLAWRVWQDRNYSNFVLELIFISIALYGLIIS